MHKQQCDATGTSTLAGQVLQQHSRLKPSLHSLVKHLGSK
jgi:hypothetical protein